MSLLGWAVLALANHGFAFANLEDVGVPEFQIDAMSALAESRCPTEWSDFLEVDSGGLGIEGTTLSAEDEVLARVVWRDWHRMFGYQHEHFQAFVLIASSQVASYLVYEDYLRTGTVGNFDGDPIELRNVFAKKTELLGCMFPKQTEVKWPLYSRVWSQVLDPLECTSWLDMSAAVLALDVAAAGTSGANDQLTAVLEATIGRCEKDKNL